MRSASRYDDEGTVRNKAIYVSLGVRSDGTKEIFGLWIEQTEVMNELKSHGLIAIVDGLKRFPKRSRRLSAGPRCRPASSISSAIRSPSSRTRTDRCRGVEANLQGQGRR